MSTSPLIWSANLDMPLAWAQDRPISRRQYLADVQALAERLPAAGPMLNLTGDRYHFAVGLGAALMRGHFNLLPANHAADTLERLCAAFPTAYCTQDHWAPAALKTQPMPRLCYAQEHAPVWAYSTPAGTPSVSNEALVAQVLTSGSTGMPTPHAKHWGALQLGAHAESQLLARAMNLPSLVGVNIVATVPPQHMYGLESTVLIALLGGAAFDASKPFFAADIAAALSRMPRPCMLVTTPFHLKMLLNSGLHLPPIDLVLCATAPLSPQLAARAELAFEAPLLEIYGCTEAGRVASRRTTEGAQWHTLEGLRVQGQGDQCRIEGGHVRQSTPLADVLEVLDAHTFRLLGRSNDLINIAGKRSSLSHLNFHLNSIDGVDDGAFWLPSREAEAAELALEDVVRPLAFVVSSRWPSSQAQASVLQALRQRIDPVFLPRRVLRVPSLPRETGTGKLPAPLFETWARAQLAFDSHVDATRARP